MSDFVAHHVESRFDCEGFPCVVALHSLGHRVGYVGVPIGHSLYGIAYDNLYDDTDVHGGLTYSRDDPTYPVFHQARHWWFGFDAAHWNDGRDWDALEARWPVETEIYRNLMADFPLICDGPVRTTEFMEGECRCLAKQLVILVKTEELLMEVLARAEDKDI